MVFLIIKFKKKSLITGGKQSPGARLKSLKLSGLRITYRALFAIGRGAISLTVKI